MQFKRIFVATDFSPASDEALREAHERARSAGCRLAVCHIIPNDLKSNLLFPHFSRKAASEIPIQVDNARKVLTERVAQITGRTGDDVTIITDHGTPYAEIVNAAEHWKADLIVIGSHGMTSAAGILMGSTTHKVIRYAHSAVLVVRQPNVTGGIVAGTDFSDPALPAISAAAYESRRTKRPLTVVHSIHFGFTPASPGLMAYGGPAPALADEDYASMKRDAMTRLENALSRFDARGEAVVTSGPAGAALINLAKERGAALLVAGTRGLTGLKRVLLGSVAEDVVSGAPCSVLIIRLH